jgi:endonuclease YncB( thermonuclease family)
VDVADGDTITLLDSARAQHRIRLAHIDAPEKGQPFGSVSKNSLAQMVFGRPIRADCPEADRFERKICVITLPDGTNINLEQVRRGLAWHYVRYTAVGVAQTLMMQNL